MTPAIYTLTMLKAYLQGAVASMKALEATAAVARKACPTANVYPSGDHCAGRRAAYCDILAMIEGIEAHEAKVAEAAKGDGISRAIHDESGFVTGSYDPLV